MKWLIAVIAGMLASSFVILVYWLGGGDFERNVALAFASVISTVLGVIVGGVTHEELKESE